ESRVESPSSEFPETEKPALRPESKASRQRHTLRPPCTRCAASARRRMHSDSFRPSLLGLAFRRERGENLLETVNAAERSSQRMKLQTTIVGVAGQGLEFLQRRDGAVAVAGPGIN